MHPGSDSLRRPVHRQSREQWSLMWERTGVPFPGNNNCYVSREEDSGSPGSPSGQGWKVPTGAPPKIQLPDSIYRRPQAKGIPTSNCSPQMNPTLPFKNRCSYLSRPQFPRLGVCL